MKSGILKLILEQGLFSFSRFVLSVTIANSFGVNLFSDFVLLWTIGQFMSVVYTPLVITPLLSKEHFKYVNNFIGGLQIVNIIVCLIFLLLMYISSFLVTDDHAFSFAFSLYSSCFYLSDYIRKALLVKGRDRLMAIYTGVVSFLTLTICALVYFYNLISPFVLVLCMSLVYLLPGYSVIFDSKIKSVTIEEVKTILITSYDYLSSTFFLSLVQYFSGSLFVYVSALVLADQVIADIGAAKNVIGPIIIVLVVIDTYYTPFLSKRMAEKNLNSLDDEVVKTLGKVMFLFLGLSISLSLISKELVVFLYGEEYLLSNVVLLGFLLSIPFQAGARYLIIYLRLRGFTEIIMHSALVVFVFTSIFTFPLVYYYNYWGVASLVILQQFLLFSTFLIFWWRKGTNKQELIK